MTYCLLAFVFTGSYAHSMSPTAFVGGMGFAAASVHDDRDPAISYVGSWIQNTEANRYGGTQSCSRYSGDTATFSFTGTQISYVYAKQDNLGVAAIAIDGKLVDSLDEYSAVKIDNQITTYSGLTNGPHTIAITALGTKNSQSSDSYVVIDGFILGAETATSGVYDDLDPTISYAGDWGHVSWSHRYAGTQSYSSGRGSTATFSFTGTQIGYVYAKQNNLGLVQIAIDGKPVDSIDEYSDIEIDQQIATYSGLTNGQHTVVVTALGTANKMSLGAYIVLDGFIAGPASSPIGVYDDPDPTVSYTGAWGKSSGGNRYSGTQSFSNHPGDTATFSFTGTQVSYLYAKQPNLGIAQISIDGVLMENIDEYSPVEIGQQLATFAGLTRGIHSLVITVTGSANSRSNGQYLVVDGFVGIPTAGLSAFYGLQSSVNQLNTQFSALSSTNVANANDIASIRSTLDNLSQQMLATSQTVSSLVSQLSSVAALPSFVDNESPVGSLDGTNSTFTLSSTPNPASSLALFRNGILLRQKSDYSIAGNQIVFANVNPLPQPGDTLSASYRH